MKNTVSVSKKDNICRITSSLEQTLSTAKKHNFVYRKCIHNKNISYSK